MAVHAHPYTPRFAAEQPGYSPNWGITLLALSAASWAVTIAAVRLVVALI